MAISNSMHTAAKTSGTLQYLSPWWNLNRWPSLVRALAMFAIYLFIVQYSCSVVASFNFNFLSENYDRQKWWSQYGFETSRYSSLIHNWWRDGWEGAQFLVFGLKWQLWWQLIRNDCWKLGMTSYCSQTATIEFSLKFWPWRYMTSHRSIKKWPRTTMDSLFGHKRQA